MLSAHRALALSVALAVGLAAPPSAAFAKGPSDKSSQTATASSPGSQAGTPPSAVTPAGASANPAGAGNPLSGFPSPQVSTASTPTQTVAPVTTGSSGSGLGGNSALVIAIGALIVLGGISMFIWRDARRRAPVKAGSAGYDGRSRAGSKQPPKPRKLSPAERRRRKRGRARR